MVGGGGGGCCVLLHVHVCTFMYARMLITCTCDLGILKCRGWSYDCVVLCSIAGGCLCPFHHVCN